MVKLKQKQPLKKEEKKKESWRRNKTLIPVGKRGINLLYTEQWAFGGQLIE